MMSKTAAATILRALIDFRNGVQDAAAATLVTADTPKQSERMFRTQVFALHKACVQSVMSELRGLGVTAPCKRCGGKGKRVGIDTAPVRCKQCDGTGWEFNRPTDDRKHDGKRI
jgi:hypothetical protein